MVWKSSGNLCDRTDLAWPEKSADHEALNQALNGTAPAVLVAPLLSKTDFKAFSDFAAQPDISAIGYASAQYQRAGFDNVTWFDAGDYQGAELRALAEKFELAVLASPAALPTANFLQA